MARAKSTDRAEARRKHRAVLAAQATAIESPESEPSEDGSQPAGPRPAARQSRPPVAGQSTSGPRSQPRVGVFEALRSSVRPVNFREDLAALPAITLHSRAIWLPGILMVVGVLAALVSGDGIVRQAVLAVMYPAPILPAFLAGILAPRAAYLAGAIIGAIGGTLYFVLALLLAVLPGATGETVSVPSAGEAFLFFVYFAVGGLLYGLLFGAFASFYRRFLSLSAGARNQNQRQRGQKSGRAPARGR